MKLKIYFVLRMILKKEFSKKPLLCEELREKLIDFD